MNVLTEMKTVATRWTLTSYKQWGQTISRVKWKAIDTGLVVGENKYENKPFNDFKRGFYFVRTLGK